MSTSQDVPDLGPFEEAWRVVSLAFDAAGGVVGHAPVECRSTIWGERLVFALHPPMANGR